VVRVKDGIPALAVAVALVLVVPAHAGPQQDFNAVYGDWKADHDVTSCRFSRTELENAYQVANGSPDFQYETGFSDEVQREIARWKSGGCSGVPPLSVRKRSPLYGAKVVAVSGRGKAKSEFVRIRNTTRKMLVFRRASIRNVKRQKAFFPAGFRLRAGKTALVRVGCEGGKRRASSRGTRVFLCRRRPLFADRGDAPGLADAAGTLVSRRSYGSETRRLSY
jgi:hypothetical protein